MKLDTIQRSSRAAALGAAIVLSLGAATACTTTSRTGPADVVTSTAAAMPSSATFIADMPPASGAAMRTMAVVVEGDHVIAYATNGSTDDAYFFGTQQNGHMNLTSTYADTLTASFDGGRLTGELAMNEDGSSVQTFAATEVAAPAGLYTAARDQSRATWVVHPDLTAVGVMDNSAPGNHKVTDAIAMQNQQFKDSVRRMRLNRQMQVAPQMTGGTWSMTMHGTTMTATRVTADMSF